MKKPILAVPVLRGFALRCVVLCFATTALFVMAAAQDKAAEPSHLAGWVVIPVEEYRVLRAKAYPVEHDPEPPPLDATLTRVDYDLHVLGDLATGRASLTVDVLKDGWVRVPVPTGLLVREARLDGQLVSLVARARRTSAPCFRTQDDGSWLSMWTCPSRQQQATRTYRFPPQNQE